MNQPAKLAKPLFTVSLAIAFAWTTITFAQTEPVTSESESPAVAILSPAIKDLLKEKHGVLKRRHANVKALHEAGNRDYSIEDVHDSHLDLLRVELELAETPADRRRILEAQLAFRRSVEDHYREQHKFHVPDPFGVQYFKSTADRIDAQIALAREGQPVNE